MFKIGDLRHRITLMTFEVVEDEWFNQYEEWVEIAHLWAKVTNLHGSEYFAAATVQMEKMLLFTIRYTEGIDETMLIRFQDRDYDIQFIDNIKYRNKYMEIKAQLSGR